MINPKEEQNVPPIKTNKNNDIKKIIICFFLSRLLLILFIIIKQDLSVFELYDSIHYINIAQFGYIESQLYAFFPLYPLLIRTVAILIPSYHISGAIISNLCSLLSLLILNKLTKDKTNNDLLMCFVFSPILAFTSIVYTESLFMLLTLLGYYLYKKDRYFLSGIIIGLSILTRNSGIILWGSIGLDMLYRLFIKKDKTIKFKNIVIFGLISLLIGMIYPIYLYIQTGDFLKFATVQTEYWYRELGTPIECLVKDVQVLIRGGKNFILNIIIFIENWTSLIFAIILSIKIFKKDKLSSIYIIVSLICFTTTHRNINYWLSLSSVSLFRYVLGLFPIYIYLFDNKKESINKLIYLIFILLSIFNVILIYTGFFLG